jgi:hypothetical protein
VALFDTLLSSHRIIFAELKIHSALLCCYH